ncbi:hypothetical protein GCM10022225_13960 [Plantactinospora mayteni]|uniref:Uncharacterized protein n=1 Tax=Plantactinospora mayteni TaxID=566021 RepID=A0ABQ4EFH0_9ACTN|nr:hypothetical protein Pma05_00440 [Plantactinospora mayteni]
MVLAEVAVLADVVVLADVAVRGVVVVLVDVVVLVEVAVLADVSEPCPGGRTQRIGTVILAGLPVPVGTLDPESARCRAVAATPADRCSTGVRGRSPRSGAWPCRRPPPPPAVGAATSDGDAGECGRTTGIRVSDLATVAAGCGCPAGIGAGGAAGRGTGRDPWRGPAAWAGTAVAAPPARGRAAGGTPSVRVGAGPSGCGDAAAGAETVDGVDRSGVTPECGDGSAGERGRRLVAGLGAATGRGRATIRGWASGGSGVPRPTGGRTCW